MTPDSPRHLRHPGEGDGIASARIGRCWRANVLAMTAGPDDSWPWPNIERPELTMDADGWPRDVMLNWSYNNKFGVEPFAADYLVPISVRDDGTTYLGKSGDFQVVGVYRDGAWHGGGSRAAFDRLREDAATHWPEGAVRLVRDWSHQRWPTWPEIVSAVRPDLTADEVDAWLSCGLTRRSARYDLSLRRRGWQFDVPDDWLQTVGPVVASLMDGGRFIVPWWLDLHLRGLG